MGRANSFASGLMGDCDVVSTLNLSRPTSELRRALWPGTYTSEKAVPDQGTKGDRLCLVRRKANQRRRDDMTDAEIILCDMNEFGGQSSFDWESDYRFAKALGDARAIEVYHRLLNSHSPSPVQCAVQRSVDHIRRRRLRALRMLVKQGAIESQWLGTGHGGRTVFGVGRMRTYHIKERLNYATG